MRRAALALGAAVMLGGKRCAMPFLADAYGIFYNKDLFAKAGIAGPPKTLDELAELIKNVPTTTATLADPHHVDWNLVTAATVLTMAPIIIVFFFAQRAFVQGVTLTGVKG